MNPLRLLAAALLCAVLSNVPAAAQYQTPPPELARLVDAPATPSVTVSPDGSTMAILPRQALPTIEDLAQAELRLAGRRINPATFGPTRQLYTTSILLKPVAEGEATPASGLPQDARLDDVAWSPLGRMLAFTHTGRDGVQLWVLDAVSGEARRLSNRLVNASLGGPTLAWSPDGAGIYVRLRPLDAGPAPAPSVEATRPVIQETSGDAAPTRTYQDLLETPADEALLVYYGTAQMARVGLDGGVTELASPGLITDFAPSPSGLYLLVERVHRPFSYLVTLSRFPTTIDIWNPDGTPVARIADLPLMENVPTGFGSVPTGRRSVQWRAGRESTLAWVEAMDGGNGNVEAAVRDALFELEEPFSGPPRRLIELPLRYAGAYWSDHGFFLVQERWTASRTRRMYRVGDDGGEPLTVFDVSYEERFADPGSPMTVDRPVGRVLAVAPDGGVYFSGEGASADGERPFVRVRDLATGSEREVFRSRDPRYEEPRELLPGGRLLIRTEASDSPPNYAAVDLADGSTTLLTAFEHPYPDLAEVRRELLTYHRADGVQLSATLYLPPGYDRERDGPLPTLVWAYPREFKSADAAGQVAESPYRFKSVSYWGAIPYVTRGYAVMDGASMPIVGEGDTEPNDRFVAQLVANAEAVVAEGARLGVVDPERVAVGGHSYGAFMTANLLAHSDVFRAGIARSGAYNRSLTPFGFQAEPRTFWEAPEVYFTMSPFMNAEKVNEPILLIHGMADNNSGTFPVQSERFYHALKGLGATARLVMLPHESHGYRARESLLHMLWETDAWLDAHVRNAPPRTVKVRDPIGD